MAQQPGESELREITDKFAPAHQRLVSAARRILRTRLPAAHEIVYQYRTWFVISYSPNEKGYEGVLAIRGDVNGVKLYFTNGKELPDSGKLLKGSANARYIEIEKTSTLTDPAVSHLMDEAIARNRTAFAPSGRGSIVIRSKSTTKRPKRS